MKNEVIIIGAGGHAKVIADIIIKSNDNLLGYLDDYKTDAVLGYPILGKISEIEKISEKVPWGSPF